MYREREREIDHNIIHIHIRMRIRIHTHVGRQAALALGVEREAPASGDARVLPCDRAEELLLGRTRGEGARDFR